MSNRRIDNPYAEFPFTLAGCPVCGDDVDLHEWVDVNENNVIVSCDRTEN